MTMRVGLDTSIVLRLLTGEPESLATAAARYVENRMAAGDVVVVSDLVVSEAYFALQYHFGLSKAQALDVLREFLRLAGIESVGAAKTVLETPRLASARPGLVDRLIHAEYLRRADEMLSFEKAAARLPHVRVMRA